MDYKKPLILSLVLALAFLALLLGYPNKQEITQEENFWSAIPCSDLESGLFSENACCPYSLANVKKQKFSCGVANNFEPAQLETLTLNSMEDKLTGQKPSVKLSWTHNPRASGYQVFRRMNFSSDTLINFPPILDKNGKTKKRQIVYAPGWSNWSLAAVVKVKKNKRSNKVISFQGLIKPLVANRKKNDIHITEKLRQGDFLSKAQALEYRIISYDNSGKALADSGTLPVGQINDQQNHEESQSQESHQNSTGINSEVKDPRPQTVGSGCIPSCPQGSRCGDDGCGGTCPCHNRCTVFGICLTKVDGVGPSECEKSADCKHNECRPAESGGYCIRISTPGKDECSNISGGTDPKCAHLKCDSKFYCRLGGSGTDCTREGDCGHNICNGSICKRIAGPSPTGEDECPKPGLSLTCMIGKKVSDTNVSKLITAIEQNNSFEATNRTVGDLTAPINIEVFQDLTCGMCQYSFHNIIPDLISQYVEGGIAKITFKEFPLGLDPKVVDLAKGAICADQQGQYIRYLLEVYGDNENSEKLLPSEYASKIKVNTEEFNKCLQKEETRNAVEADFAEGSKRNVPGTPAFFINGKAIFGAQPIEEFNKAIDAEVAKLQSRS